MKFSTEKSDLHRAIQITSKAASSKSPIPALEGLLLEVMPEQVKITGYDLKKAIYTSIDANIQTQGSMILNARIFSNIISSLPEGAVDLESQGQNVRIKGETAEFNITGMDAADYPELPDTDGKTGVSLPQNLLSRMIRQTIFAVSDNESRPVYTGELFEISQGSLTLVAVDGYRLALRREPVKDLETEHSFIVPGTALGDLEKLCADTEDPVRISLGTKHISFTIGDTVLLTRRLEGEFLNYKKTVPSEFQYRLRADRQGLQRCIERVSLLIDDRVKNPLRCTFQRDELKILSSTSLGKAEDSFPLEGDGQGLEIGFNNRYILDCLKAAPADEVRLCLNSSNSPCVILPPDDTEEFLYMVLPVRLKA